jgi:hypothetical protein
METMLSSHYGRARLALDFESIEGKLLKGLH